MISQEIRRAFLRFFKDKEHRLVPSSSVVPHEDPSLLFTNAGMNQFKDVFLGKSKRDYTRATTSQKCLRVGGKHNDLDNVGHTTRHLTLFEMLGNFSFGDYFKQEAIAFAWEVSTQVFKFDPKDIWITIFEKDDESFELWQKWVSSDRIVRMGEADNYWSMGETGPCGPCSELFFDKGPDYGSASSPKEDVAGERYLEFWNLVFMQFNRDEKGKMTPLPKQCVDAGAGLERVVSLKMGVDDVFQTDVLQALIKAVEKRAQKRYDSSDATLAPAFHVIADHLRSLAFAIADGAQPSNVERGYVLRKLLRRAVRYGRMLGLDKPFLADILPTLIEVMGADYPELKNSQERTAEILTLEEEAFLRTLKRGGTLLNNVIEKAQKSAHKQISGEDAFKLKDTYGLPLEEILLIAKDYNVQVNLDAYLLLEEKAKERSRSAHVSHKQEAEESLFKDYLDNHPPSEFLGYEELEAEGSVMALIVGSQFVKSVQEGDEALVVLDRTPFYAEKGGQVGDTGELEHHSLHFKVTDCQNPYPGIIVHKGKVTKGILLIGEPVVAKVEKTKRQEIENNHTATHLLHYALEQVLGPHIRQGGSLVEEKRLRFDFSHHKPLSRDEVRQVERMVNEKIREGTDVKSYELSYDEAQKKSEIKQFFGDKYGEKVRVVDIDYSKELCGGTHTHSLSSIGLFRITKETSIAAGVRRIEAVTGSEAETWMYATDDLLCKTGTLLKVAPSQVLEKTESLCEHHKQLEHELKALKKESLKNLCKTLLEGADTTKEITLITAAVSIDPQLLSELSILLEQHLSSFVIVLGAKTKERAQLLAKVSSDLIQKGIKAGDLIKAIAPAIEGSGGGRPEMAQAGGKNSAGIQKALDDARQWIQAKTYTETT